MKIGVIGASGKAGALIAAEAKQRGHEVTAIVRDKNKVAGKDYGVIEKNLFDLSAQDLSGLDVVISAFGTPFDGSADEQHITAAEHLIAVFGELPQTRLIVIGGAASLYTDPDKKRQALEDIPEPFRGVPAAAAKGLAKFQESAVNWTFFSPAMMFDPQGKKAGSYILGTDFVIPNAAGESYLSYADAAAALVDEAEKGAHKGKRFTAVSENLAPPRAADGYYGILGKKPVFEGLSRYRPPFNYELAGKQFRLVMDNGLVYHVNFIAGKYLEWSSAQGAETRRLYYECAKIDELTYFVNFEYRDAQGRINPTLILDMEQRLVTIVVTRTAFSKKYPTLVESEYFFGAIDLEGFPLPEKRHGFTTDLVGKRIHWHYSPDTEIIHVYYSPHNIRITFPPFPMAARAALPPPEALSDDARDFMNYSYEEPTTYIKIKRNLYVINSVEKHKAMRGLSGNSMLFLMDVERVHDVGRSFGHREDHVTPENYLFGAYGDFVYSDGKIEAEKSRYTDV
jgi:putative NADH-flavin reductase